MDIDNFLDQFEVAFVNDISIDVVQFINDRVPDRDRSVALSKAIETAFQIKGYDYKWLSNQLSRRDLNCSSDWIVSTLRSIFQTATQFERPFWGSKIALPGIRLEELKLQSDFERFALGATVGSYQLLDRIGQGGALIAYRGEDKSSGSFVTIRVPRFHAENDGKFLENLRREFLVLQGLASKNLLGVQRQIESFEFENVPISVCEYIHGRTLRELSDEIKDPKDALLIVGQVARIAQRVHQSGHIHGDIKLENVLVSDDGTITLIDFNVSLPLDPTVPRLPPYSGTLSSMGFDSIAGSEAEIDVRRDVYALGTLLHELVSKKPIIQASSRGAAFVALATLPFFKESLFAPETPLAIQSIVEIATSRDVNNRFEDCNDLADACIQASANLDKPVQPNRDPRFLLFRIGRAIGEISRQASILIPLSKKATLLGGTKGLGKAEQENFIGFASIGEERRNIKLLSVQLSFPLPDPDPEDFYGAVPMKITRATPELLLKIEERLSTLNSWEEATLNALTMVYEQDSLSYGLLAFGYFVGKHRENAALDPNFHQLSSSPELIELNTLVATAVSDAKIEKVASRMQHCERQVKEWLSRKAAI